MRKPSPPEDNHLPRPDNRSFIVLILSIVLVWVALLFPGHPKSFEASAFLRLPIELPALILLLLLAGERTARWLSVVLVFAMSLLLLLRLADIGSYLAFNRRFSPLLEFHLLADGWNLASTSIGPTEAGIVIVLIIIVLLALTYLLYQCLRNISQVSGRARKILLPVCTSALLIGVSGIAAEYHFSYNGPVEAKTLPEFYQRITSVKKSIVDQREFVDELQKDVVLNTRPPTFQALKGHDVIVIFVESYGRGYIDAERFTTGASERLKSMDKTLTRAGLSSRSGWLTSPIRGGRSWLAHSTFQSGLEISNQARFDRLISSDRVSVTRLFEQAGWSTVGFMPAIQLAWPEGAWYGYEDLRTNDDLGFAGERFGYATMPDQYTLAHFENTIRQNSDVPVMGTIALLSTHAPWTPLPKKLDWDLIGDGSVYDGSHRFGERVSWKYRSKVQDMYAQSFDYTLDIIAEYAAKFADDAVIVVLGDHQPPPIINGWGRSGDVPVHIIAKSQALLERLPEKHWVWGMRPDDSVESQRMSGMRQILSTVFE